MGRQAYLDKIAFGRSAFEPTRPATPSTEHIQLESAQSEIPQRYHDATANNYTQLYDERGKPINPRSIAYAKKLRGAQNDVLASVGVVERKRSITERLPGSSDERFRLLEAEDVAGNTVAFVITLTRDVCSWWAGMIRDRILTFRYPNALSFAQLVARERASSGASLLYGGFVLRGIATLGMQATIFCVYRHQPIERLLHATHASIRTRNLFRRASTALKSCLRLGVEALFYPFFYHVALQRLGLVPARPLFPTGASLVPVSASSPLLPFSSYYDASASVLDCVKAVLTSPFVLLCVEHSLERWLSSLVGEAVDSSVLRPDDAGIQGRDVASKDHASPPVLHKVINKLLVTLGWALPLDWRAPGWEGGIESQTMNVGGTRVVNATPLNLPVVQIEEGPMAEPPTEAEVIAIPMDAVEGMMASTSRPTMSESGAGQDDNDPRIRITSREGVVEMEVRLPPRILSAHSEVAEAGGPWLRHNATGCRNETGIWSGHSRHRVTKLSSEPAQMICAMVRARLVGIAMIPIRMATLQLIASHFVARRGGSAAGTTRPLVSALEVWGSKLRWQSVGAQLSRVALCGAVEVCMDVSFWGLEYVAATRIGERVFGWGSL